MLLNIMKKLSIGVPDKSTSLCLPYQHYQCYQCLSIPSLCGGVGLLLKIMLAAKRPTKLGLGMDWCLLRPTLVMSVMSVPTLPMGGAFVNTLNREELHNLLKIPSSIERGNYLSVSLANKICVNQLPKDLFLFFYVTTPFGGIFGAKELPILYRSQVF
jgi:hypothetical protein